MKCKIPRPPQNKRPKGLPYHSQQQRTGKGFNLPSDKKLTNIDVIQKAIQPRQSRLLKKLHFYKLYGYYAQASLLVCLERPSRITTTRNE
jgi:hypothetical protein